MTSTYTSKLRLNLQGTGDNANSWGDIANTQVFQLLEDAITGAVSVSTNGGVNTLSTNNGSTDQDRMAMIMVNGVLSVNATIVAPSLSKWWLVQNNTTAGFVVNFQMAGGSGFNVPQDQRPYLVVATGVSVYGVGAAFAINSSVAVSVSTVSNKFSPAVAVG
jgi:hypothetical protein